MAPQSPPKSPPSVRSSLNFDTVRAQGNAFGNMMKNAQSAFEDNVRILSDETLQFINKRLEHNSEAIAQCREGKDVSALVAAQQKWFMDMAQDYYAEAVRMGDVTRRAFSNGRSTADAAMQAQPARAEKQAP